MEITVKELSIQLGIGVSAVHNSLKRNEKELKNHTRKEGRTILIDDYAQEIIREKSIGKPQSQISDTSMIEELNNLRKENSQLKDIIIAKQQQEIEQTKQLAISEQQKMLLIEKDSKLEILQQQINDMKTFTGWWKNRK